MVGAPSEHAGTRLAPSTPSTKPVVRDHREVELSRLADLQLTGEDRLERGKVALPRVVLLLLGGQRSRGFASGPTEDVGRTASMPGSAPGDPSRMPAGGLNAMFGKLCAKTGVSAGVAVNEDASSGEWKNRPVTLPKVTGWSEAAITRTVSTSSVAPRRSVPPGEVQVTRALAVTVPAVGSVELRVRGRGGAGRQRVRYVGQRHVPEPVHVQLGVDRVGRGRATVGELHLPVGLLARGSRRGEHQVHVDAAEPLSRPGGLLGCEQGPDRRVGRPEHGTGEDAVVELGEPGEVRRSGLVVAAGRDRRQVRRTVERHGLAGGDRGERGQVAAVEHPGVADGRGEGDPGVGDAAALVTQGVDEVVGRPGEGPRATTARGGLDLDPQRGHHGRVGEGRRASAGVSITWATPDQAPVLRGSTVVPSTELP